MMENRMTKSQLLLASAFLTTTTKNINKSQLNSYNFLLAENGQNQGEEKKIQLIMSNSTKYHIRNGSLRISWLEIV